MPGASESKSPLQLVLPVLGDDATAIPDPEKARDALRNDRISNADQFRCENYAPKTRTLTTV
jgi:hypothetical protein